MTQMDLFGEDKDIRERASRRRVASRLPMVEEDAPRPQPIAVRYELDHRIFAREMMALIVRRLGLPKRRDAEVEKLAYEISLASEGYFKSLDTLALIEPAGRS